MTTWRPDRPPGSETGPARVGDHLQGVARRLGLPDPGVLGKVFGRWREVAGAPLCDHVAPESLRDGVLLLATDDPAWASQIRFLEPLLLARIAEVVGGDGVRKVEVRVRGVRTRRRPPPALP